MEKMTGKQQLRLAEIFKRKSTRPHLRSQRSNEEERFLWSTLSTARTASGRGTGVRPLWCRQKTSCAIVHGLYTLCLIHSHHPHTSHNLNSLLVAKKNKKTLWVDITQLESLSLLFPLHRFFLFFVFFLSFYLNSWYARGRKRVVIILWCAAPSLCSGYYKGTGREAGRVMLCYAVLRYAMHAQCGENAGIMGISIQRRAKQGPGLNVHNLSSH